MPDVSTRCFQFSSKSFFTEIKIFFKNLISNILEFYFSHLTFTFASHFKGYVCSQCFFATCAIKENLVLQQQNTIRHEKIMGVDLLLLKSESYYLQL